MDAPKVAATSAAAPPAANQMPHRPSVAASAAMLIMMTASQKYRLSMPNNMLYPPFLFHQYSITREKSIVTARIFFSSLNNFHT